MYIFRNIKHLANKYIKLAIVRDLSKNVSKNQSDLIKMNKTGQKIGPFGWFLISIPTTTFCLGTWQIKRKKWKEDLIAKLKKKSKSKPRLLPEDLSELDSLEYHPVYVRGVFQHDKELYMGPRSLLVQGDASTQGGLISKGQSTNSGFVVVTPFKLVDRDLTILVNRGWVPARKKDPKTRMKGQITEEVDVVGVVRLKENRPTFVPNNRPDSNSWFYRDLEKMGQVTNSAPVFIDAVTEADIEGGPIGGQTRISLRNEHLSYVFTWYSLCAFTSFMWYRQFVKGLPPI